MIKNTNYEKPKVIAEIGCNHKGDFEIAKQMINIAKVYCGANIVKFQKRTPKELLTPEEYNAPHPNPRNSYGDTYGEHREFLEFTREQHKELLDYCKELGVIYSCSVWDFTSAKEIISLNPEMIKIPSANSTNFKLLKYIIDNYNGKIHLSIGMTSKKEVDSIIDFFVKNNRNKDLVIYHCTSAYPVEFKDTNLLEILFLKENYEEIIDSIGFSGHHKGIAIDIAAYTLGAQWIERHFTLDRTWKGTDHAASLEPDGLRKLIRDLNATYEALKFKKVDYLDVEIPQMEKLRWDRNNIKLR
ncbi:N-acetylneuraminate synthase family protein [Thermoanaerobacterium thermosaccharolyticum]|uniref:Sialic acid synthase n=1 Tax=Thermoanaerobacterium thermosaccharolyticum M0795 TaxID=698948 RepID=L0IIE5_THETR|nr:N-acetylneuraminate synthase family protein [Thermoanaerobacterium thermosaccharolyticum]AGB18529.1 sialic acid synthase [Thermoanaerobacterium thermosaccharolyticum M0795]